MPRWFVLLAFPVVLGFACVTATMAARELDPATAYQRAEDARHAAAMNAIAEAEAQERARVLAPALALAGAVLALGASGVLVVLGAVYAWHRLQFVDVQGVSVSRQLALDGATVPAMLLTVATTGQARIEAARNPAPALPPGLRSYSPKYANRELAAPNRQSSILNPQSLPPGPSSLAPVPSLAQVLTAQPAGQVVVGYERNGTPLTLGLDAIGATLVVGERRTGKSTTVAVLAAQLAALRAQFFLIDPHGQREDSLAWRLSPLGDRVAMCVSTPSEASGVLRAVTGELERRLAGEEGDPCVLLVDELNSMAVGAWADVGREVAALAQRLAQEGGKLGMGVIAAAHLTNVDSIGSHFAYTTSTVIAHRTVPDMVRRFLGPDLARQTRRLDRGEVVTTYPGGWGLLRVPRAEPGDILQAVATLPAPAGCPPPVQPATGATASEAVVDETTTRRNRIQHLAALGYSRNRISLEVFGHKDDGTLNEIRAVLGPVQE